MYVNCAQEHSVFCRVCTYLQIMASLPEDSDVNNQSPKLNSSSVQVSQLSDQDGEFKPSAVTSSPPLSFGIRDHLPFEANVPIREREGFASTQHNATAGSSACK